MQSERRRVEYSEICLVLDEPTRDDGKTASRRIGRRTIIVHYTESDDEVFIRGVSATRSPLPPKVP